MKEKRLRWLVHPSSSYVNNNNYCNNWAMLKERGGGGGGRGRKRKNLRVSGRNSGETTLSPADQPVADGLIYVIRYLISRICLWLIPHTHTHTHSSILPLYIVLFHDGHVLSRCLFFRPVVSKLPREANFRNVLESCVVHRRLHILTRVAMQNILSPRNHVSRRVASSVVYHNEDLQSTSLCTRLRFLLASFAGRITNTDRVLMLIVSRREKFLSRASMYFG